MCKALFIFPSRVSEIFTPFDFIKVFFLKPKKKILEKFLFTFFSPLMQE